MKSKVHPRYKTKYRVANWPAYNQALVRRGDVTVWLSSEAIAAWTPRRSGQRGGQRRYSDLAIETALTLRLLYHLPLRQAEGFLRALFGMMRLDLAAPDYTTLSRRSQHLRRRLRLVPPGEGLHLVLDSTGLSIVGEGEWATAKHGGRGRRGWRKLHLGVDQSGGIRVHTLTEETGDDATTALDLLTAVEGPLVRITADAAYDTVAVYETATARGATVVIPPARTATVSGHGPRSPARDRTITLVKTLGRRQWQKASGYHEIMSHAVWLYHRFDVRFRDAADLLAQHGLTVSDDAIRLWCLDFDSADARRLTRRQGRLGDIWHRDKVVVRYGPVDATLVDRPPRGWARASREPAMLGTNNGRRPQLDTTVRSHQRGIGRHRPTDAVAACPKHVGVQGESCLQPQRLADTPQRVGVVGAGGPAVGEALLRRQIGVFGEDPSGPLGRPPQAVDLSDGAGNGRHQRSTPHRSVSERSTRATVERQPAAERLVIGDVCGPTVRGSHRGVQGVVASPAAASRAAPRPPRVSQAPHASVSES